MYIDTDSPSPEIPQPETNNQNYIVKFEIRHHGQVDYISALINPNGHTPETAYTILSSIPLLSSFEQMAIEPQVHWQRPTETPDNTLDALQKTTRLEDRPKILSQPSKILNRLVNENYAAITDEEINKIIESTTRSNKLRRRGLDRAENILERVFSKAYYSVTKDLQADSELRMQLDSVINGIITFTNSSEGLLFENRDLLPRIVTGVCNKIMVVSGLSFDQTLEKLISFGSTRFNQIIYDLRTGKNGSLFGLYTVEKQFDIAFTETGDLVVSLNPEIAQAKESRRREHNHNSAEYVRALEGFQTAARQAGVRIDFLTTEGFGLKYGRSSGCPVTHGDKNDGKAYLPQVELAFRVLEAIKQYREQKIRDKMTVNLLRTIGGMFGRISVFNKAR